MSRSVFEVPGRSRVTAHTIGKPRFARRRTRPQFRVYHLALLVVATIPTVASHVIAQDLADVVWLAPSKNTDAQTGWYPKPVTKVLGKVVTLDNKQLAVLIVGDEVPSRMAAYRVLWIEPGKRSQTESNALQLFADRDYASALRPLLDSLEDRPPVWRQQWLSMLAAYAARQSDRGEIALELVGQLDARPLPPYVLAWLPVEWRNSRQSAASIEAAKTKLNSQSAAVRLVAASWLIGSSHRDAAETTLKRLSNDGKRPFIAQLAEAVLWRAATPPQIAAQSATLQERLDSLPMVLQTGPMITLFEKFQAAGLEQEAKNLQLSLELIRPIPFP